MSETTIYADFELLMAERKIPAIPLRTNAGERIVIDPETGGRYRIKFMPAGYPDYQLLGAAGRVLFIEFKTATGKMRDAQRAWQNRLTDLGFGHVVARSAESAADVAAQFFARAREG